MSKIERFFPVYQIILIKIPRSSMKGVITMVRSYPIQECFPLKRSCFSRPVLVFRKQDRGAGGPLTSNIPPMLSKRFDFKHLKKNKETYCFGMGEPWGLVQWWLDVL